MVWNRIEYQVGYWGKEAQAKGKDIREPVSVCT